jgi:hypothetical protein
MTSKPTFFSQPTRSRRHKEADALGIGTAAANGSPSPCGEGRGEGERPLRTASIHRHVGFVRSFLTLAILCIACFLIAARPALASESNDKSKGDDLSSHSFPALGSSFKRRVDVAWNQFYDTAGLANILEKIHKEFPNLTKLYSLGKSYEGRDLWCLEVTAPGGMSADRKPAIYIDGNIHGNEVQGGEVVAFTAWYLCHQYSNLEAVTDLLEHNVFYLVPTINPDGRDFWLHGANTASTSRSGAVPRDNDRDGLVDEDDYDDLDGDGSITQMRIKDPNGRWKKHPRFPEYLMVPAEPDEPGEYTLLGYEGIDNDGDGLINEDPKGGYDPNRNWAWDWQPDYIQSGSMDYPFSLPETHEVAEFFLRHPNIAAAQSFHNNGGMILRGPGRDGGQISSGDDRVMQFIAQRGEQVLPFYRSMVIYKDLYTVWGGELDWFYGARGVLSFTCEIWNSRSLNKGANPPSRDEEAEIIKFLLMDDAVVKWHEFNHPTYGKIEIGGLKKTWGRTPTSFLLEEECHRNMAFTLFHASQLPRLTFSEIKVEPIGEKLSRVWVTIENSRMIPTRIQQDVNNHISMPDILTLSGRGVKVLSAGKVTDRFFKKVEPVKRRPERLEIDTIPGMGTARVQFVVSGTGAFTLKLDSAKGGVLTKEANLP